MVWNDLLTNLLAGLIIWLAQRITNEYEQRERLRAQKRLQRKAAQRLRKCRGARKGSGKKEIYRTAKKAAKNTSQSPKGLNPP
jgi:hypothetical protein